MTDDDGEFRPSESTMSNLTSLFDSNKLHPNENHSLTYVAPKAPKAGESCATSKQSGSKSSSHKELKIITSKSVRVYKLESGIYVNQGTAGIAIVGNHGLHLYQVILYKNNKDHLCKTHITPNFSLTVLENNYVSFYDTSGQNWSILFSSSCNIQEFAKQVAIAKYNSQINQERIIVQDLSPLGGPKVKKGDMVKVAYTCSVLENDEIVPWKEKGTVMIEVTDVNAFPWHEGIKDWSEHCMRIVIIPYKLSAPWINDINENTSVVMELELVNITSSCSDKPLIQKEKEKEKSDEADVGMKTKGGGVMENSEDEGHCKGKATSLKGKIFFSRSHKTDIISRIARIGQGLPVSGPVVSGPSDSEDESSSMLRQGMKMTSVKNAVQQLHRSLPVHFGQCLTEAENSYCNNANDEIHRNQKITQSQEQTKMRRAMNVVAEEWEPCRNIENESEGSRCSVTSFVDMEIRTSIHKLSEKVDEVLKTLQNLDYSKVDRLEGRESGGVMDPINVLTSIPDFIVEHENLKTEMELQRLAIDEQNKKIETLTDLTLRCVEKCSITERKVTAEKKQMMPSEKQVAKSKWSEANAGTNEPGCEARQCQKEDSSENQGVRYRGYLVEDIGKTQDGVHDSERKSDCTVADKECQVFWNEGEKKEILNDRTKDNGETCSGSKAPENILCEGSFEEIKRVMNAVNKKLQSYFEPGMNYSGSEVKAIIASTIKDVTVEYLRYKLKLRWSCGTEFNGRDPSERRLEGLREQRTEGEQQECGSHSHVRETLDSAGNSGQRNSHDIRSVTSSKLPVNTSGKDTESRSGVEKSGLCASEVESNRNKVCLEPSGISRVSDITAATRNNYYGRDIREGGMKSASDSEKKYSKASSRSHRLSFANEDPILENIGETGNRGKRSFPSSRKTLTDAGEEAVVSSSSLRLDNAGMTFSKNQRIYQQEMFVGSKSLIECRGDNDLEGEKCEITICKNEEDTKGVIKSSSPSQRCISVAEGNTLESGKITLSNSPRLSRDEEVVELGEGVVELAESSKSVVSELTKRDAVRTISRPYTVAVDNEESCWNERIDGNGLDARGVVIAKSETMGVGREEAKNSGKNVKDETSEKISNLGLRALPSLQSMSRVRSKGSRVDNTFEEYNSGVSFRIPDVKGVENGKIEMLDENLMGRDREVKKSTVLTEPLSDISASRDENSSTDGNFRNVTDLGGTEKYSAGEADVAASVVESNMRNVESKNDNVRDKGFESGNAKILAVEENSYGSETEKAVSSSKTTIPDEIEPGGATGERSTVSGLGRSVIEEGTASTSVRMKENGVENDGVTSGCGTSNLWESVESRPFSTGPTVIGKESVIGVESRGEEDGKMGSTEGKANDKENEKGEIEGGNLNEHDQESLIGQENIKSSVTTSANGACHFPDYYQNWVLSKPPPLPLEEEDDEDDDDVNIVDNDEEWSDRKLFGIE